MKIEDLRQRLNEEEGNPLMPICISLEDARELVREHEEFNSYCNDREDEWKQTLKVVQAEKREDEKAGQAAFIWLFFCGMALAAILVMALKNGGAVRLW